MILLVSLIASVLLGIEIPGAARNTGLYPPSASPPMDIQLEDCLAPRKGTARDTLRWSANRRHVGDEHDLTRPASSDDSAALRLIGQYIDRCLGTRRELFLAQKIRIHENAQIFLVRRRPQRPYSSGTGAAPEASAYLITVANQPMSISRVLEFRRSNRAERNELTRPS